MRLLSAGDSAVALTGAGISTDSGIPDFRGPKGVWTRDPGAERLSTLDAYVSDPEVRVRSWQQRLAHPAWTAEPNAGHLALANLQQRGVLSTIITQNIDGLHQRAGAEDVLEIHGTLHETICLSCSDRRPMRQTLQRVAAGEEDPPCVICGGILKSATISFGQALDEQVWAAAQRAAAGCDVFLAVGTSLTVYPVAGLCDLALAAGARLVIVNAQPTPYDEVASVVVNEPIAEVLAGLGAERSE